MKRLRDQLILIGLVIISVVVPFFNIAAQGTGEIKATKPTGQIYLYGEQHGVAEILEKEFELWYNYYHKDGLRHLFVEYPYYTASLLNLWMQADNDDIFDELFNDWVGFPVHTPSTYDLYMKIKKECPETVFHGIDIGAMFLTTGQRYWDYLIENGLEDTEEYQLTLRAIQQGKEFYDTWNLAYRETMMVQNFIHEFDRLDGENVMGIYGWGHTDLEGLDESRSVPSLAKALREHYGDNVHAENLTLIKHPLRMDIVRIAGKDFIASYFGESDMSWSEDYVSREFWRIEAAYDFFKNNKKSGEILPNINYPMAVEVGQVFMVIQVKNDGDVRISYLRSDGNLWEGLPITEGFREDTSLETEPLRLDMITVAGKDFKALYYGKQEALSPDTEYACFEYWRLEDAYEYFKDNVRTGSVVPYFNFPMLVEDGQILCIKQVMKDGTSYDCFYRSDGHLWCGITVAFEFWEDLSTLQEPLRIEKITVNDIEFTASYFGRADLLRFNEGYAYREFWRLEGAYAYFKDKQRTKEHIKYENCPMPVEIGQAYLIREVKKDGTVYNRIYRSDGNRWNGLPAIEEVFTQ